MITKSKKKKPVATKAERVLAMLKRPGGATGQELMKATGWQFCRCSIASSGVLAAFQ